MTSWFSFPTGISRFSLPTIISGFSEVFPTGASSLLFRFSIEISSLWLCSSISSSFIPIKLSQVFWFFHKLLTTKSLISPWWFMTIKRSLAHLTLCVVSCKIDLKNKGILRYTFCFKCAINFRWQARATSNLWSHVIYFWIISTTSFHGFVSELGL